MMAAERLKSRGDWFICFDAADDGVGDFSRNHIGIKQRRGQESYHYRSAQMKLYETSLAQTLVLSCIDWALSILGRGKASNFKQYEMHARIAAEYASAKQAVIAWEF